MLAWLRALVVVALSVSAISGCVIEEQGGGPKVGSAEQRLRSQLDLGRGYLQSGDLQKARTALEKALQIDSGAWEAYDLTATMHIVEGEDALAEKAWRSAIRYGGGARARRNLASFLMKHQRAPEACKELSAATEDLAYEHRAQVFQDLGACQIALGKKKEALAAFRRATELNDNQPDAWLGLADLALEIGDTVVAGAAYQKYRTMAKPTPRSLLLGVRLADATKDLNAEASYALMLRNLFPESAEYRRYQEMRQ